jgi:hypothetical protein
MNKPDRNSRIRVNDRIDQAPTPVARIAAVCIELTLSMQRNHDRLPDYADLRKVLEPYILEIELTARADEARMAKSGAIQERIANLDKQLSSIRFRDEF